MFSEMTSMRPAWLRSPDAAIAIVLTKSIFGLLFRRLPAYRHLDQAYALSIQRRRRLIIHLVRRDLDHLVLEIDCVAGGANLEPAVALGLKLGRAVGIGAGVVRGTGLHQGNRRFGSCH